MNTEEKDKYIKKLENENLELKKLINKILKQIKNSIQSE